MNRTMPEKIVLRRLGIPDFRHMTKEKVVKFVSMLPYMDPEVAKKALEQFPAFRELTVEILKEYRSIIDRILSENTSSQDAFYKVSNSIILALQKELEKDDLTAEDRNQIEEKMLEVARMISEKDSENKSFLLKIVAITGFFVFGIIGTAAAMLGSNTQTPDDNMNMGYGDSIG